MQGIFHPKWTTHYRPLVATAEMATVRVYRNSGEGGFTEDGWQDSVDVLIYEGKARWQKTGQTTKRDFSEDYAQFSRIRVQISMEGVQEFNPDFEGFNQNDKVVLVENPSNPISEGSVAYVWGTPTSSNAWHYTLQCQENQKQLG